MSSSRSYYQERGGRPSPAGGGRHHPPPANHQRPPGGALRRAAPRAEEHRGDRPPLHVGKRVCLAYCFHGRCRYNAGCRFSHGLRCIGNKLEAHRDRMLQVVLGVKPGGYQMFTTGKDLQLIQWELRPNAGAGARPDDQQLSALFPAEAVAAALAARSFELVAANATAMPAMPTALYLLDDLLLIAMRGGLIRGFEAKLNTQFSVAGHAKDVNSMLITQHMPPGSPAVLVTGDMDGQLSMYSPGLDANAQPMFSLVQQNKASFPISRLKHIENTFLVIVGGIGFVAVYNMQENGWLAQWRCEGAAADDAPRLVCLSINRVDAMYLATFTCGEGLCINAAGGLEGRVRLPLPPGHNNMLCAAGWLPRQKRLIAGYENGTIMSIDLVTLRAEWNLPAHEDQVRQVAALDDFFVTVSHDASIGVWRLADEIAGK